jgi:23S rRNA pseudouridine2604 synthase
MRLNKFISESGRCSRRDADDWIAAGRVTVNGRRAEIGDVVDDDDEVRVDGDLVRPRNAPGARPRTYIALHKPVGITCTTEPEVEGNIVDFVDYPARIFPIGRLDKDSQGLILLTDDGDIVNRLLRVENRHEKEYVVEVHRPVTPAFLASMARGVNLGGREITRPCRVSKIGPKVFRIVLTQGLNRQIRRMCEAHGYFVRSLTRVRIVNVGLGHLKPGQWRKLSPAEVAGLLAPPREPAAAPRARTFVPPPSKAARAPPRVGPRAGTKPTGSAAHRDSAGAGARSVGPGRGRGTTARSRRPLR